MGGELAGRVEPLLAQRTDEVVEVHTSSCVTPIGRSTTVRIAGFDLSMTATGVAAPDGALHLWRPTSNNDHRLLELSIRAETFLTEQALLDLAVVEDLPRHALGSGVTAMVHGVVRAELVRRGVPVVLVPPSTLKVYACGRGNATKPDMRVELLKRVGIDERDDNLVDAWWLRALGHDLAGEPLLALPATHRRALDKLTLPVAA